MTINCLIIEDDPIYREMIRSFARKVPQLNVVATCASAQEALTHLLSGDVTLIFCDIRMDDLSGLEFIRSLQDPPFTVFITSFPDYAVEGFQVDAVDYIVKPVTFDRFLKAVNKVQVRLGAEGLPNSQVIPLKDDHFYIRTDGQYHRLKYEDVIFIEAYGDFTKIHTEKLQHICLVNLKNLEEQLPRAVFIRVHRSYLVNISRIDSVDNTEIRAMQFTIPIGTRYKDGVYATVVEKKLVRRFSQDSPQDGAVT